MKRLIFCADGTWNNVDKGQRTNVARICEAIATQDSQDTQQVARYDAGVGSSPWERIRGGVFGYGLGRNVRDAYEFFVEHYEPGDEIYLFGFSRGAYTARSAVGMIRTAGILKKPDKTLVDQAYKLYRDTEVRPDDVKACKFRESNSHEVHVRCIGVWDTVGSLGIPIRGGLRDLVRVLPIIGSRYRKRFEFHDAELSSIVDAAFHAVAIDEKRAGFEATLWSDSGHQQDAGTLDSVAAAAAAGQIVEQVWFPGVHSDVGGDYQDDRGLADVALAWMIDRAGSMGLAFNEEWLADNLRPNALATLHESRKGLYLALKRRERRIPTRAVMAASVADRRGNVTPPYGPTNLKDYVARRECQKEPALNLPS